MLNDIKTAVEQGKIKEIEEMVQNALDSGEEAQSILNAMVEALDTIGEKFQLGEVFVPEMLISALTMKNGVALLKPYFGEGDTTKHGTMIIGTAEGDLHDIGKNIVALMIEGAGFEIIDLGVDVPKEKFVEALKQNPDCGFVGISTLLTTTMDNMEGTITAIAEAGLRDRVTIFVGGAPVSEPFAKSIGADVFAPDAGSAAQKIKALIL